MTVVARLVVPNPLSAFRAVHQASLFRFDVEKFTRDTIKRNLFTLQKISTFLLIWLRFIKIDWCLARAVLWRQALGVNVEENLFGWQIVPWFEWKYSNLGIWASGSQLLVDCSRISKLWKLLLVHHKLHVQTFICISPAHYKQLHLRILKFKFKSIPRAANSDFVTRVEIKLTFYGTETCIEPRQTTWFTSLERTHFFDVRA